MGGGGGGGGGGGADFACAFVIVADLFPAVLERGVGGGELGVGVEGILSKVDVELFFDLLVVEFRLTGRGETIKINKYKNYKQ